MAIGRGLHRARTWLLVGATLAQLSLLPGCATAPRPVASAQELALANAWSGRLALTVHSTPAQAFSAGFDLTGNAEKGELRLYSPLGNTLAALTWSPQGALLQQGSAQSQAGSVQDLLQQVTGTELPLRALFDWLQGKNPTVPGWTAKLAQLPEGQLQVHRSRPEPAVDLRIVLD